jgi:hypothetical protein
MEIRGATTSLKPNSLDVRSALRQWRFRAEFRIAAPRWPEELLVVLERLERALAVAQPATPVATPLPPGRGRSDDATVLADIGVGLWRLKRRILQPWTDRPLEEEKRRAYRHLESVWDTLELAGVEIVDHTDQPFDAGMSLKVIAFEPMPGLEREQVIETIKPTVYIGDQLVQTGEVVVGTPEESHEPGMAGQRRSEQGEV